LIKKLDVDLNKASKLVIGGLNLGDSLFENLLKTNLSEFNESLF